MNALRDIPMGPLAIIVGTISAIGWIAIGGTTALVISMVAGATIAVKSSLGDED